MFKTLFRPLVVLTCAASAFINHSVLPQASAASCAHSTLSESNERANGTAVTSACVDSISVTLDKFVYLPTLVRAVVPLSIQRASIGDGISGVQSDGPSYDGMVSANGQFVAFGSNATNLVATPVVTQAQVYVRNLQTQQNEIISLNSAGQPMNSSVVVVYGISDDGQRVIFNTSDGLVPIDTNACADIYLRDRVAKTTELVSVGQAGATPNDCVREAAISGNGRYVVFASGSSNLVANDTNDKYDVFLRDLQTQTTTRISTGLNGAQGNDESGGPSISQDGRWITFASIASNLVANDSNRCSSGFFTPVQYNCSDVFLYDTQTSALKRISVSSTGTEGDRDSGGSFLIAFAAGTKISGNGRYVIYDSAARNLVGDDTNNAQDVFLYDIQTATTTRVSVTASGQEASGLASSISGDGGSILFSSNSAVLPGATGEFQIYLRNRASGETRLVSAGPAGTGDRESNITRSSVSADGAVMVFFTSSTNIIQNDTNGKLDVFVAKQ